MKRKKLIIVAIAIIALSLAIVTTSYGYWTDKLSISGQSNFEYSLSIIKDVEITKNDSPVNLVTDIDTSEDLVTDIDMSEDLVTDIDTSEDEEPEKDDNGEL